MYVHTCVICILVFPAPLHYAWHILVSQCFLKNEKGFRANQFFHSHLGWGVRSEEDVLGEGCPIPSAKAHLCNRSPGPPCGPLCLGLTAGAGACEGLVPCALAVPGGGRSFLCMLPGQGIMCLHSNFIFRCKILMVLALDGARSCPPERHYLLAGGE